MDNKYNYTGLTYDQVEESRKINGRNIIHLKEDNVILQVFTHIVLEPMFILLVIVAVIYFIIARYQDGSIMLLAILFVAGISFFQNFRSRRAVEALNKFHSSNPLVIRENTVQQILPQDVVVGDILLIEEGEMIAADGFILSSNDLSIDESILTGESIPVAKSEKSKDIVYKNTLVNNGSAIIKVDAVGRNTRAGRIGSMMRAVQVERTPLQIQIDAFLKRMIWFGVGAFVLVVIFKFIQSFDFVESAMQGLTMAMSVLPEEIPVAFSTFLALGAYRLMAHNIIVRHPQYVEGLGAATVICLDKTGTITQNSMAISFIYDQKDRCSIPVDDTSKIPVELLEYAVWSSEKDPFDKMEKSIHQLYEKVSLTDKRKLYTQIHEYPLGGSPPMMTHIFTSDNGDYIIAAKGAPEAILPLCDLSEEEKNIFSRQSQHYAQQGYRVLAVAKSMADKPWPVSQQEFQFIFLGLIAFNDPPKENIAEVIRGFGEAGVKVNMVTGDFTGTAVAVASQVGIGAADVMTGKEVMQLDDEVLRRKITGIKIYARMYPESKLRLINALKQNQEIVAMTGDGVNDAPALKAAHIGIAMGQKGSAVAKKAASIIIADDDLAHMIEAISLGRKIYDNLKKAIRYIISIHIPIIMIVSLPVLLYWKFSVVFTPVHVIFLELIMGPTCSIVYENEPAEPGIMKRKPARMHAGFLMSSQLILSIVQGLVAGGACLLAGFYFSQSGSSNNEVRTVIFLTLLFCNLMLTLENRSDKLSIFYILSFRNNLMVAVFIINLLFIGGIMFMPYIQKIFMVETPSIFIVVVCILTALAGTMWVELWKYYIRKKDHS
jgi:Ca2+-transporting ATPase